MFLSLGLLQASASNFSSYLLFRLHPNFSLYVSGLSQLEISLHPDLTITVSGKPQSLYQTSKFLSGLQGTKSYCSVWGGVDIRSLVYVLVSLHLGSKNAHPGVQSGIGASAGKVCHLIHNQGMRCADSLQHTPPRLFYQALKNLSFNPTSPGKLLPPLTLTLLSFVTAKLLQDYGLYFFLHLSIFHLLLNSLKSASHPHPLH